MKNTGIILCVLALLLTVGCSKNSPNSTQVTIRDTTYINGTQKQWTLLNCAVSAKSLISNGNVLIAFGSTLQGISAMSRSTDTGDTWTTVNINFYVRAFAKFGNTLFAGTQDSIYRSTDNGLTWNGITGSPKYIGTFLVHGNTLLAGMTNSPDNGGLYRSTDNGTTWDTINNTNYITAMAANGNTLFALSSYNVVFRSTDDGLTWDSISIITSTSLNTMVSIGNTLLIGGISRIIRSVDNGITWAVCNNFNCQTLFASGNKVFAGNCSIAQVLSSSDSGYTWSTAGNGLNSVYCYSFVQLGKYLFAGTSNGIWRLDISE